MELQYNVERVYQLVEQEQFIDALNIIEDSVELYAPHVIHSFPQNLSLPEQQSLVLAKLYLTEQKYPECVAHALRAKNLLCSLDASLRNCLIFHMMEYLLVLQERKVSREIEKLAESTNYEDQSFSNEFYQALKDFVVENIKNDKANASSVGYLADIGEIRLCAEKLLELSTENSDPNILHIVDEYWDEIHQVFLQMQNLNLPFLKATVDAYIYKSSGKYNEDSDSNAKLVEFLNALPWDKMYQACFYIEDTYGLNLVLNNENANFILSGDWKNEILSNFMFQNSKTSFKFIEAMGKYRAPYVSLCNCLMNAGTTNDTLYRNNKTVSSAREWTRFMDYAAIGLIHQGNVNPFDILKEMLPSMEDNSGEPAALMALGSMAVGHCDKEITDFLLNWVESPQDEMVFGACMGIGLNMLGSCDTSIIERLKALFSVDSTIVQESAIYAIGLICASSKNKEIHREILDFLSTVFSKTDFIRVKRVCGVASALVNIRSTKGAYFDINYNHQTDKNNISNDINDSINDNSDISDIINNKNTFICNDLNAEEPLIRASTINSLALEYAGTGDLEVVEKLLPFINDPDNDVKREAVIAIGFIGYEDREITESCLMPLAQNHNMHVRSAAATVLGLFNSGLCSNSVCDALEAMLYDSEELVRQGAAMGLGFALAQANPALVSNYERKLGQINQMIAGKSEGAGAKIGAALGRAFSEVGGRSAIFSLRNLSGRIETKRVAGAMLFLQSWYWYPLMSCIGMCILPTPIFFYDENLDENGFTYENDQKFFDFLVKMPESKKSRKYKKNKSPEDTRDLYTPAPEGLK
ncbi:26S proteasome regulatory subunit N2, partial [Enteropsectra breve]